MPTLVIGARTTPWTRSTWSGWRRRLPKGRYLYCPNGSHLAMYDDQQTYFTGLTTFLHDVEAGRF